MQTQTNTYFLNVLGFDLEVEAMVEYTQEEYSQPHDEQDYRSVDTEVTGVEILSVADIDEIIVDDFLDLKTPNGTIKELIIDKIRNEFIAE